MAALRLLEDRLRRLREEIHSVDLLERLVTDLNEVCINEVTDKQIEPYNSLLFDQQLGIVQFLRKNVTLIPDIKAKLLEFLSKYVERVGKKIQPYVIDLKSICLWSYNQDKAAKVKNASIVLLVLVFGVADPSKLPDLDIKNLFEKFYTEMLQVTKLANTVRANIYRLLGSISECCPEYMQDYAEVLVDVFLKSLKQEMNTKTRKPEFIIIAASLEGLTSCLMKHTPFADEDSPEIYDLLLYTRKAINPDLTLSRYDMPKAGLNLFARHCALFSHFLIDIYEEMYDALLKWCQHKNRDLWRFGHYAMEGFITQMAKTLTLGEVEDRRQSSIFKFFVKKFHDIMINNQASKNEVSLAVRSYGLLAAPCKKFLSIEDVRDMFREMLCRCRQQFEGDADERKDQMYSLPSYLEALASIVKELDYVSEESLITLEHLLVLMLEHFPQVYFRKQFLSTKAAVKLMLALMPMETVFREFLSGAVYQGLIRTCSHAVVLEAESSTDAVPVTNFKKQISYKDYMDLWSGLLNSANNKELALIGYSIEERNRLTELLYDEIMSSILKILKRLDLSVTQGGSLVQQVSEESTSNNTTDFMESADPVFGLKPSRLQDHLILVNLVNFCSDFLPQNNFQMFDRWLLQFTESIVILSSSHPLVSGFYKLLSVSMKLANKLHYFKDISGVQVNISEVQDRNIKERIICFILMKKFTKEVLVQMKQYRDDLLASCLTLVLSLPSELIVNQLKDLIPAAQLALSLGVSYLPLANIGMDALEYWSKVLPAEVLQPVYPDILPYLDSYLRSSEKGADDVSLDSMANLPKSKGSFGKKVLLRSTKKKATRVEYKSELGQIKLRIINYLGKIGGSVNRSLLANTQKEISERSVAWDTEKHLKFDFPFFDMRPTIYFDAFLPHLLELATKSSDRQTKSVACECLHSLVVFSLGRSAQQSMQAQQQVPMDKLYRKLFPALLQLACDVELLSKQLFEPLVFQLIHWFTSRNQSKTEESMSLLDVIYDGITQSADTALRDFSARCLSEYLKWSIKQLTPKMLEKDPKNVESVLKHMYSYALHPNPFKRLGAALAFNNFYTIFREYDTLVDQFIFNILVHFVKCLAISHTDEKSLGVHIQCNKVLDHLERIIIKKADLLMTVNNQRTEPSYWTQITLENAVRWLVRQCGRPQTECRHACMKLVYNLAPHIPGIKMINDYFNIFLKREGPKYFLIRFEGGGDGAMPGESIKECPTLEKKETFNLQETCQWFENILASLDCYTWLFSHDLLTPAEMFADIGPDSTKIFVALCYFLEHVAFFGVREMADKKKGDLVDSLFFTPREQEKFNRIKCTVIIRLFNFLTIVLQQCHRVQDYSFIPEELWSKFLWKTLTDCILSPTKLGFDLGDVEIINKLPTEMKQVLGALLKFLPSKNLDSLKEYILNDLKEERNLIKLLPIDLKEIKLNFYDLQQMMSGYSVLGHVGFLRDNSGQLAENLFLNVFRCIVCKSSSGALKSTLLTPMEFELTKNMIELAFKLPLPLNIYMEVILDKSPLGSQAQSAHTHGELQFTLYKEEMINYIIQNRNSVVPLLTKKANIDSHFIGHVLIETLDHLSKDKSLRKGAGIQMCTILLNSWNHFECWWKNDASVDNQTMTLTFLTKLLLINSQVLSDVNQPVCGQIHQMFYTLLSSKKTTLAFKSSVLELLPFLCVTPEPFNSELKECLDGFVADCFPLSSQEFLPHSPPYNDYISALDKILMALKLTRSPMLVKLLITIFCREEKHIHEAAILRLLESFIKRVPSCEQKQFAEIPYNLAMKVESCPINVLKSAILKVCLPLLKVMSKVAVIEFFCSNISHMMNILESKVIKWSEEKLERQLTEQLSCLQILQVMYFRLEKEDVNSKSSSIQKVYCEGKEIVGNELTKTITKICHKIKSEDMHGETLCLETYRQLHCSAYNLLISIISCTQTEPKFYTAFLFSENPTKSEYLFDNLIDKTREYTFPVEIQSNLEKKNTFVSIRDELRSLRKRKGHGMDSGQQSSSYHLSSVYLADSSLSADFGRYDFTSTAGHMSFTSITEEENSKNQEQTSNTSSSTQPDDTEITDTDIGYALLEMDELNQHDVMAPLVALLRHMQDSNITPKIPMGEKSSEMPSWMAKLHKKMTDNSTHVNIKVFIAKLILNTAGIFEPYALFWLTPLCELIVSGSLGYNTLSYFTTDIIVTMLRWHKTAIPQDTIEDRALVSRLVNFIFTNIYHETRSIFRENLDMLKTLLECWKERIEIPYAIIYNKMMDFDVKSMESMTGVQLIGVILSCQIAPYAVTDEISQKQFFSCLAKGFQHNYKAVYTATAEVFGLILKYYFEHQPDSVENIFEILLPTINQMQSKQPDRFIICLHKMQRHYSQAANQHLSQLFFLLPKVHGEFRAQCLEIIHGSISNYENIFIELKSKGLISFLSHRDESTQLIALRIVKTILPKLEPNEVEYLLSTIIDLILHPSYECRKLTYDLLMWIYDNYKDEDSSESNKIIESTKDALLRGLTDEDMHCRLLIQNFWSSNDRLPEGTLERIVAILKLMYSPKTENHFLNYATNLILEMTSKSPEYTRKIYEFPLSECKFQDYKLQSSWQQRHATMTPLFVSSQTSGDNPEEDMETGYVQASVDTSHKEYTPTQGAFNWLTQSSVGTFAETDMDVDTSSSLLFSQGSTATASAKAPLSTRKKPGSDFGKSKLGGKHAASTSNQKSSKEETSQSDRFRLRRRFLKDHESKHIFFAKQQIRLAQMREKVRQDQQSKREHQVTIYRKYRTGELPDIQIEYSCIIAPLQGVAERDNTIAKLLFSSLFKGIFDKMSSVKTEKESKSITLEISENFKKILNISTEYFPPFIGCILNILYDLHKELPVSSDIIVRSALASNLQSLGIVLLEERLIQTSGDSSGPRAKRARKIPSEPSADMMTWIDLARLYKSNKEHDTLVGIFKEQISSQEDSQKAINAEICGDYSHAVMLYNEALSNLEETSDDHFETETKFWSSCLIQCLENLTQWGKIESECTERIGSRNGNMDSFWDNNDYQDLYLSPFIKSKLKLMQQGDSSQQTLLNFIDEAMNITERRDILENQFSKDLSMMFLLQENYSRALHYIQDSMDNFLENWQSTDVLMNSSRIYMLQNLQTMIEIQEFLKIVSEEKNFISLDNVKHLLEVWIKRTPSVLEDSVIVWDDVIMNRLSYIEKFHSLREKHLAGESMSTDEKNCFLQNKLKLKLMIVHNSCAQNNFKLALKMLKKTAEISKNPLGDSLKLEWSHLYAETHQKKASLNTNWTNLTLHDFMTVFSNLGKQDSNPLLQDQPHFQRKHDILYAQCYELLAKKFLEENDLKFEALQTETKQKILNIVDVGEQVSQKELIDNLIRRGYEHIKKGVRPQTKEDDTTSPLIIESKGQAYLAVAKYCDTFLQAFEEESVSESTVSKFPETMVKSLFSAIQCDILEARQRFCRLLQLLEEYPDTMDIFLVEAEKIPCWMFLIWINQMMSMVDKPESKAIQSILLKITHLYPQAVVYSFKTSQEGFKFSTTPQGNENEMFVKKLDNLLGCEELKSVQHFIKSLELLSNPVNIYKDWLQEMTVIMKSNDRQKAVDSYLVMYDKLFNFSETTKSGHSSQSSFEDSGPYCKRFAKEFRSKFEGLFGKKGEKLKSMYLQDFMQCNKKLKDPMSVFGCPDPKTLKEYSSWLANFDPLQNNLEIPGQYHGLTKPLPEYHIKIAGFNQKVVTFASLRKPRKIIILGNDEKEYAYVVKGGEDLRQDQRIQFLFESMNQIFRNDSASKSRNLYLKTYKVIPMTTRIGMIEFLDDVSTLKEIFLQNLEQRGQKKSYAQARDKYNEILKPFAHKPGPESYSSLYSMCNRTKVQLNLDNAASLVPWDLLRQSFLKMSTSPKVFHVLQTNFALSHAVMCVCHYMLGVGDRHLSNLMIHHGSGRMIGIDFGHAFGSATQILPVPELMPFRLTKQILNVFLPHQTKGILEGTMTCALNALRSDKDLLLLMLDIFIKEPSLDWLQNAQKQANGNTDEDISWYPKEKIDIVKRKFLGENPCYITRDELKLGHSKNPAFKNWELVVLGDKKYNIRAQLPQKFLTCDQQVSALIDQATDPAILGRTYIGWDPYM